MQIDWHSCLLMLRRAWRAVASWSRNAPLIVSTLTVSVTLEVFGWGYLFLTNHASAAILGVHIPMALIEGTIITASGLIALIAAFVAAERRSDPRPEVRRRHWHAQALAFVMLAAPILKAADGFAFPQQVDAAAAFAASDQAAEFRRVARESTDALERSQAMAELARGITPTRAKMDGTWFACLLFASFLYMANMLAASLLWRVKPETPGERAARERREDRDRRERRQKREHELRLEQLRAETKGRGGWLRGVFSGKRDAA